VLAQSCAGAGRTGQNLRTLSALRGRVTCPWTAEKPARAADKAGRAIGSFISFISLDGTIR
jgi:hypothetical protein